MTLRRVVSVRNLALKKYPSFIPSLSIIEEDNISYDPFLLFDHLGPITFLPYEAFGAHDHPHKGMYIISYLIEGCIIHGTSISKSKSFLNSGDVHIISSGRGIIHYELPSQEMVVNGGTLEAFQIWINSKMESKADKPYMQDISSADIPIIRSEDNFSEIRIIGGELLGASSTLSVDPPICLCDITLKSSSYLSDQELRISLPSSEFQTAMIYAWKCPASGGIRVVADQGEQTICVERGCVASLDSVGDELLLQLYKADSEIFFIFHSD